MFCYLFTVLSLVPVENFPNEFMAILFSLLFVVFFIIELRIFTKQRLSSGYEHDKMSMLIILICTFVPLIIVFVLAYLGIGRLPTFVSYIGLVFVVLSFAYRQWAIFVLGKYFTPIISIQKSQKLIQNGPYKYIRHPSYTGFFFEIVGVGLFLSNWLAIIIIIIPLLHSLIYRISIEEKFLITEFGNEYISYKKRTKKLIPFIY